MADKERLIDAELLTTNIAQIAKNCARSDAQKALIGRILYMIENMPTIEAEPDNGWISVEDRLPEEDGIIHSYFVAIGEWVGVMVFYGGEFREGVCGKKTDFPVHHWMPLPEPPKGE